MKKYKGFTLIELVAVITLLALIVLVTVPIIINTLSKADQKEYEDFKKLVANAAELYVERNRELYPDLNEIGGVVDINAETLVNEGYLKNDLQNPINDKLITDYKIIVSVNQDKIFDYEIYERNNLVDLFPISKDYTLEDIDKCSINGKCNAGIPFNIKVNDTEIYNFYVISDDGNKVTLIMDRNLGNRVRWYANSADNSYGPVTALEYLNNQTTNWNNIDPIKRYIYNNNLNGTTNTSGYQKLEIENGLGKLTSQDGDTITEIEGISRARLITVEEAESDKIGCGASDGSCPIWLYENLSEDYVSHITPRGYWIISAVSDDLNNAPLICYEGMIVHGSVNYGGHGGVRPVIEISRY